MAEATSSKSILLRYLRPERRRATLLAVLLLASIALPLATPQIIRKFIDGALDKAPMDGLLRLAVWFLVVSVAAQLISVATTYVSEQVGWRTTNNLRSDVAAHALGLDIAWHNTHTPGEMIERVDGDITALSNFFSMFVIQILGSGLLMIGILALTFRESALMGTVMTVFALVSLLVMTKLRRIAVPDSTAQRESSANLFGFLEERLSGVDDVRANGAGHHVMRGFARVSRDLVGRAVKAEKTGVMIWVSSSVLYGSGLAMILALSAWLYLRGRISPGTVVLLFQYFGMLDDPLMTIGAQVKEFQKAGAGIVRIQEMFGLSSAMRDGSSGVPEAGPLGVTFERVGFAYPDDDVAVLHDLTLSLRPGEVLGVLGRTGSGKTTIGRLILRLYDVRAGSIRLAGVDLREANMSELRKRVGVVTQDVQLFQGTVRDNLTLFEDGFDDGRITSVLQELGLGNWLGGLPQGLDSELASGGGGLSAGEAQLLAFARVFLRDPGLVILDEATSRLDPATEAVLEHAVDRLLEGRTGILIAHRLRTVHRADSILILDQGRVVEHGPREQLASDRTSRFSSLLAAGIEEVLA
ncbi:MAG TPA: ABC transporter ATP-binding protein [Actinomycetota bacterium]|nr:ABC transporter ATP-binding protein [Actinomycetota bacterium]